MIYFIGCTETFRVKIGYTSRNPYARLAALQTGSATELTLLAVKRGTRDDERRLHAIFAQQRVIGEWFDMSESLFDYMAIVAGMELVSCGKNNRQPPRWAQVAKDSIPELAELMA